MSIIASITNMSRLFQNICSYKLALSHGCDNVTTSWFYKIIFIQSKVDGCNKNIGKLTN